MSWKDIVANETDVREKHKNVGKIGDELDRSIRELEVNEGVVRKIRDIVGLEEGYSVNKEQRRLIKANIDSYQKLFKEIMGELR
tara:strand:+ start:381 stop:632 length:252 start_codon:yes stop_codon:yes gene_type:complete